MCTLIYFYILCYRNLLRVTRANQLQSVGGNNSTNSNFLGKKDVNFEFSHLSPIKVEFIESTATENEQQLDGIRSWQYILFAI